MLIGSGGRLGQECAHSMLLNHPLGFIGRGKVLTQALWPGMEARVRGSDGKLEGPDTEAVDVDGMYIGRDGLPKKAILNRLRFGRDGATIEGEYTSDLDSDFSDHTPNAVGGPVVPVVTLNTGEVTDPLGNNTATKIVIDDTLNAGERSQLFADYGADQTAVGQLVWLRGASGGETVYLYQFNAAVNAFNSIACVLTTSWQRFTVGGGSKRYLGFGVHEDADAGHDRQPLMTVYAWGGCFQNQFAYGTGSVDGDNPITKAADDFRLDNIGEAYSKAVQGTVLIKVIPSFNAADLTIAAYVYDDRNGSNGNLFYWSGSGFTIYVQNQKLDFTTAAVAGIANVFAWTWETDAFYAYANGLQEDSDTLGAVPPEMGNINIGQKTAQTFPWFGNLAKLIITEPVLSVRQIENATAVLRKAA